MLLFFRAPQSHNSHIFRHDRSGICLPEEFQKGNTVLVCFANAFLPFEALAICSHGPHNPYKVDIRIGRAQKRFDSGKASRGLSNLSSPRIEESFKFILMVWTCLLAEMVVINRNRRHVPSATQLTLSIQFVVDFVELVCEFTVVVSLNVSNTNRNVFYDTFFPWKSSAVFFIILVLA